MQLASAPAAAPAAPVSTPSAPTAPTQTSGSGAEGASTFTPSVTSKPETAQESTQERALRKFKLDSGEELEIDDSELEEYVKKGYSVQDTYRKAEEIRRQNEMLVRTLRENPLEILRHPKLGVDVKDLARKVLMEEIEDEMLSPEEKEMRSMKSELEKYKTQEQKAREARVKAAQEARDKEVQEAYHRMICETLDRSGLPNNRFTYESIIGYMGHKMRGGEKGVKPEHVISDVVRDYQQAISKIFDGDLPTIEKMVGAKNLEKLQKAYIERKKVQSTPPPLPISETESHAPRQKQTLEEIRQEARRRWGQ